MTRYKQAAILAFSAGALVSALLVAWTQYSAVGAVLALAGLGFCN